MSRKKIDRRTFGKMSDGPKPKAPGISAPKPNFATPAGGAPAALAALSTEVTGQLTAQGERVDALDANVMEFTGQITAALADITGLQESNARIEQGLIDGAEFQEVRDQLGHLQESGQRLEDLANAGGMAQRSPGDGLSGFSRTVAENEELIAFQQGDAREPKDSIKINLGATALPYRRAPAFGATTVVVDDSAVSAGSADAQPAGLVALLRDEVGLVDVVNQVPPETTDTYKRLVEKTEVLRGAVAAKSTNVVAGGTTAVNNIILDNVEGYWVGRSAYFFITAGVQGPFTITAVDLTLKKVTFGTTVIDFDVAVGDLMCSEDYLMTGESDFAPAGIGEVEELSVEMQALINYIPMTWQRIKRTNLFALIPWLEGLLAERKRRNLEMHLLYGSGTTSTHQLDGFLHSNNLVNTDVWATLMAVGDNVIDLIIRSAALIPGGGPRVCVMRDEDWQAAIYAKNSTLDYVHGTGEGPPIINTPALKAAGGVRVVTSEKIALKTFLNLNPAAASDFVPGGDAEVVIGTINNQLITGEATIVSRESFGHLITNANQAYRKGTFTTPPS